MDFVAALDLRLCAQEQEGWGNRRRQRRSYPGTAGEVSASVPLDSEIWKVPGVEAELGNGGSDSLWAPALQWAWGGRQGQRNTVPPPRCRSLEGETAIFEGSGGGGQAFCQGSLRHV